MNEVREYWLYSIILLCTQSVSAQEADTTARAHDWNHDIEGWFYFMQDDFIFSPVYGVDKDWLHLEGRYNYEDMNTFSAWFGYNLNGGNSFQYTITPMLGALVGNTNGLAPGLELDFDFYKFNLNSASEYIFDFKGREYDYLYTWTDFTFSPLNNLWFGLSAQRTRFYQTNRYVEYGLILGGAYKCFGLTGYIFNPDTNNPYLALYLNISLPQ